MITVAVVGASGFVGRAVSEALRRRGIEVVPVRAPRLSSEHTAGAPSPEVAGLKEAISGCDAVVNCAGIPEATSGDNSQLEGANGVLPGVIAQAASSAGVRLVHVSSSAVQGRTPILDDNRELAPFSPYSASKAAGEEAVLTYPTSVVYRPPGVHGPERHVTRRIAQLARSRMSSVAGNGQANSAQALIGNVADAIAFLATTELDPPAVVHHPSEGLTTSSLLELLGCRRPRSVPELFARAVVNIAFLLGRARPGLAGTARRLEILWFGQDQAPSWLTRAGWSPPEGLAAWNELGKQIAHKSNRQDKT